MYGSRFGRIGRRKPHLYFDKRWKIASEMQVGERGQIVADVEVTRIFTDVDDDGNEFKVAEMTIREAEKLVKFTARFA